VALKENIKAIRQEISAQEQFLESLIKGERFFKKYKWLILGVVVAIVLAAIVINVNTILKEKRVLEANETYLALLNNPNDGSALELLKKRDLKLYNLFKFSQAVKNEDKSELSALANEEFDEFLKEIVLYETTGESEELLINLTFLKEGYALLEKGDIDGANASFAKVSPASSLQNIISSLQHYQGK